MLHPPSQAGRQLQLGNSCPNHAPHPSPPPPFPPWPLRCFLHCCSKDPPVTRVPTSSLVSNPSLARYDLVFAPLLYLSHAFYAISKPSKHLWGQTTWQFHGSRQNCCWIFKWHVKRSNFGTPFCYYFDIFPQTLVFPLKIVDVRGRTRGVLLVPKLQLALFDLLRLAWTMTLL